MVSETVNSRYIMRLWQSTITKKLRRRVVLPTAIEPNWPQSTWAQSPGAKAERQEGRRSGRADLVDVILDDADAAAVAAFAQTLEDLGGGVGMGFEPADDLLLEVIELARTRRNSFAGRTCRRPATGRRCGDAGAARGRSALPSDGGCDGSRGSCSRVRSQS